ncbi:M23 family metallopeptidase [Pseudonocardia sp. GCM10023141]|uniref:M23 family metallopeptidase n=1 Tax=Pseudonocardia sp. GCM10023141 TaxID=3252653 RepID=UPI0036D2AE65
MAGSLPVPSFSAPQLALPEFSLPEFSLPRIPVPRLPAGLTSSVPARVVATALVGGALAAAGQHALADALPRAADGANVLRMGVEGLLGAPHDTVAREVPDVISYEAVAVAPVAPAPVVATADDLVKAADIQSAAAAAAATAAAAAAAEAKAAEAAKAIPHGPAGGIQMVVGQLSSGFGGRWGTVHQGLDIAAPIGTPIRVPLAGTVISSGPADGFGMWVRVQHADGTITVYGHINRSFVTVGQKVAAGDEIAEVGNRGQSTGPHLHIGVMVNGAYVDPRPWLDRNGIGY